VQVYLMLTAYTPLTGRMLLWALAPSALLGQQPGNDLAARCRDQARRGK
jgi:hypothetical protein